jgi:DNA-binding HxlR family transcriptional regulator
MHDEVMAEYLDEIPAEVRDAVSELSSPQRWAVFLAILKEDRYFNELRRELGISAEQLDNILRRLVTGGLVFKEMESPAGIGDRKKTCYTITPAGKKLVRCLLEGFLPESPSPYEKPSYIGTTQHTKKRMMVSETGGTALPYQEISHPIIRPTSITYHGKKMAVPNKKTVTAITTKKRGRPAKTTKKIAAS